MLLNIVLKILENIIRGKNWREAYLTKYEEYEKDNDEFSLNRRKLRGYLK